MEPTKEFNFNSSSVAESYDHTLVPILFDPWAKLLINELDNLDACRALDIATGTGVVASILADNVGEHGKVVGIDLNPEMLKLAKLRCQKVANRVELIESPAYPLALEDDSFDVVLCQQGFQFFPEKQEALDDMHRVLKKGGTLKLTTWDTLNKCELFNTIAMALRQVGETDLVEMIRIPFDFMPALQLKSLFEESNFKAYEITQKELPFLIPGGIDQAIDIAYATPIGPGLSELPKNKQDAFRKTLIPLLEELSPDGVHMGKMVTNVVTAKKL